MAVHNVATWSLLKCYMNWPPPAYLCNKVGTHTALAARADPGLRSFIIQQNPISRGIAPCSRQSAHIKACSSEDSNVKAGKISLLSADTPRGGLPRFHIDVLPSMKGSVVQVAGDEFWHMTRVLRLNVDDRIELFDGKGGLVEGMLSRVTNNFVEVTAVTRQQALPTTGPSWHVAAAFSTLKGGRADWLVEKCTELGAQTLTPLLTQRSAAVPRQRNDRWQRISMAATKQCQRLCSLDLREPTRLQSLLPEVEKSEVALLAAAGATPLLQVLSKLPQRPQGGLLLIGPEGDFTSEELDSLIKAGAVPVGLGQRRLRVETAAIAILTTVMLLDDSVSSDS